MLTPWRMLVKNVEAGKPLPKVPALEALYRYGCTPRHGQVIMVAGRSGTQKSGFALWWTASMRLRTLYFSADMSGFTASCRLASMMTGDSQEMVEARMATAEGQRHYRSALSQLSNMTFSTGSPITWRAVDEELAAAVELWDEWPEVVVLDNLMDFENAEASYEVQMEVMQLATMLARDTGATVIVLHHASDKTWEAKSDPWAPPSRDQIKNGMAEKPELALGVGLNKHTYEYRVAVLKQRMGPDDPTGQSGISLRCEPGKTRFHSYNIVTQESL